MSIRYDDARHLLTLETLNSSYQMKIDRYGYLQHVYYGHRISGQDMSYICKEYDRGFSGNPYAARNDRGFSLDTEGQEFSTFGTGDYRIHGLRVRNADGSCLSSLFYEKHEIVKGKYSLPGLPAMYGAADDAETLVVTLSDRATGLKARLYYGVFESLDVITRAAEFVNEGAESVCLLKAASVCLDIPYGRWDLLHFHGRHCMERQPERAPLPHGIQVVSSERGMSSHQHNPFIIVCERGADESHGDCYGLMLMYSGSFKAEAEMDQFGSSRLVMGISDTGFSWTLGRGESFFTPEAVLCFGEGLGRISHICHEAIRRHICRSRYRLEHRPVLINNWEATYFNLDEETILGLAGEAAALGIEMFVLDDGWFRGRNDDHAGLGDWYTNHEKLPHGLGALIKRIKALGLMFGLWVEPEMVNEESDLFREHPDWVLRAPAREPAAGRSQFVLDLSREDVQEHLYQAMARLLKENDIGYIKWDMNRCICDLYSAACESGRQGEVGHRYVLGVYRLLERLTGDFPEVLFEGCAGGGGRFDAGMLYYVPQIWCSDDTDALERVEIQYGTSFGYPASSMGAHVSASPNHQTGRHMPLSTRGVVAMAGTLGYELDLRKLSDEDKEEIKRQIRQYREDEPLVHDGLYYRLTDMETLPSHAAWQYVSRDKSTSLVSVVVARTRANEPLINLRLKGLDPGAIYEIRETGEKISGAALMYGGYTLWQMHGDFPSVQLHVRTID